jgi:hypothetical protein
MADTADTYRVTDETTVGEALFVVTGATDIFQRHGCDADFECTQEHHLEYVLVDTSLTCHIDDTDALIADLNAAVEAEQSTMEQIP